MFYLILWSETSSLKFTYEDLHFTSKKNYIHMLKGNIYDNHWYTSLVSKKFDQKDTHINKFERMIQK